MHLYMSFEIFRAGACVSACCPSSGVRSTVTACCGARKVASSISQHLSLGPPGQPRALVEPGLRHSCTDEDIAPTAHRELNLAQRAASSTHLFDAFNAGAQTEVVRQDAYGPTAAASRVRDREPIRSSDAGSQRAIRRKLCGCWGLPLGLLHDAVTRKPQAAVSRPVVRLDWSASAARH